MAGQQFARSNYDDETTAEWMARRQRIVDERNGVRRAEPAQAARPADNLTDLRREQEAFRKVVHAESQKNSWMAIPALAPAAVILAAEGAAAARAAKKYETETGNKTRPIYYDPKDFL
ncbi:hypothetical protein [Phenylobacterium sp.]|uniref:hypothetical protein n=1 Tax=Phenylobacterium sp. TaxID=1871053 RepID=UPI002FCA2F61